MESTFYKVRRKDDNTLFYNPDKPGNRLDPTFDKKGKKYYQLCHAEKAVNFCKQPFNDHWGSPWNPNKPSKTPVETEIVEYLETTKEIRVVQPRQR